MTDLSEHPAASQADFGIFVERLLDWAREEPRVIGLVLMGSTAERHRVDEWSDHDFAVVTVPGEQEAFRRDLSWLPGHTSTAATGREWHNGFKAVYDDGHLIEFAIVDRDELLTFAANAYDVVYDAGDVGSWMRIVHSRTATPPCTAPVDAVAVFFAQILVGVGRTRRGEVLSGAEVIRSEATATLIDLVSARLEPADPGSRDNLDRRRRFEKSFPDAARRIGDALDGSPEGAARQLLTIADDLLAPGWSAYQARGARAIRVRLGWPEPS